MLKHGLCIILALFLASACGRPVQSPLNPNSVVKGINYVGITVSDLNESTEFYSATMDLEPINASTLSSNVALDQLAGRDAVTAQTVMLRSVNAQVRLMEFDNPTSASPRPAIPLQGPGIAHVCFQVAQSTNMYARAIQSGATPIGDTDLIQLVGRNPVYYGYAKDRDNIVFEAEEVDLDKIDENRRPPNSYRIRHVSLATADLDRLVAFYSKLLDAEKARQIGGQSGISGERFDKVSGLSGSSIRMAWLQVRNLELELFEYASHRPAPPESPRAITDIGYNMIVFDVTDLALAKEKLLAAGGTIEIDAADLDGAPTLFGRDPDSNLLAFQIAPTDSVFSSQNFNGNGTKE